MTAPQPAAPPSRFQADLVTVSLIVFTAAGLGMAFVLTQQHEPVPAYMEAMIVGGLTSLGFYRASSPGQQQAVAQLAGHVDQLGTAVDLNHLDTMNAVAELAPADPPQAPIQVPEGSTMVQREGVTVVTPAPEPPHMNAGMAIATAPMQPADLPPMAPSDRPAGWEPDPMLEQLHQEATAAAPTPPAPNPLAPPLAS